MKLKYIFMYVCILICTVTQLFAGTEDHVDEIITQAEEQHGEHIDSDLLRTPIKKALDQGIADESITRLISAAVREDIATEDIVSHLEYITSSHAEGLPSYLVINTILEGIARGVPGDDIRASLMANEGRMEFCQDIAADHRGRSRRSAANTVHLTTALYNALYLGFGMDQLEQLSSTVQEHNESSIFFTNSLEVLMELYGLGLENEQSVYLINSAIDRDYRINHMRTFPNMFATHMKNGMSHEEVFTMLQNDIENPNTASSISGNGSSQSGNRSSTSASDRGSSSGGSASQSGAKKGKGSGGN
jgi:hypothetical protein